MKRRLTEVAVFNAVRNHLVDGGYETFQLVTPGGQAPFCVTVKIAGRKCIRVPDLITTKAGTVYVGELKPSFSIADQQKLGAILQDSDALVQLRRFAKSSPTAPVIGLLCHSQTGHAPVDEVDQWIFDLDGNCVVVPSARPR